jgi:hypothetical protein
MPVEMDLETKFPGMAWWGCPISNMEDGMQVFLRTFFFEVGGGEISSFPTA